MSELELHGGYIARLKREGAETRRFRKRLFEVTQDREVFDWWTRIPDAFVIDADTETITAYEVEVGKPLRNDRILAYAHLWWCLDCEDWTLRLVTVDRFGVETERPLQAAYFAALEAA